MTIKLGILQLGRGDGMAHFTYELGTSLNKCGVDITTYLSTQNIMLKSWQASNCQVRAFETYDSVGSLVWSFVSQQRLQQVVKAICIDRHSILLDTSPSPWAGIIKRALPKQITLADIVHDPTPHPDRWAMLVWLKRIFMDSKPNIQIAISEFSYKQLRQKNRNKESVILFHHGAYKGLSAIDIAEHSSKIAQSCHRFILFGRLERYKGIKYLVAAFEKAKAINPRIELTIAGRGPVANSLKIKMNQLGINFINQWLSESELDALLAEHGVIMLPYISATQSGPAAIALARGYPCIATNVGALPEQIIHERNGLIVPPRSPNSLAEAMLRLSSDPLLAKFMSQEAHQLATDKYAWDNIAARLLADITRMTF